MQSAAKNTIITGTSRGLGFDVANYFLRHGYVVAGCSRGASTIQHKNYIHHSLDLTDEKSVRLWARNLKSEMGFISTLVCNAGLVKLGSVTGATSLDEFKSFIDSNLIATFLTCREFSKIMMLQRYGRIINITSIMTELHAEGTCSYSSTKAAVAEFTKVLAKELIQFNITCNIISPSLIKTESSDEFGKKWESNMLEMQSIKRAVNPNELAHMIEFFSSEKSSCLTGQTLSTCLIS